MRDVLMLPFTKGEMLVIASDNSGAIGQKTDDTVKVPYEIAAYYSFRVAVMECMSAGAKPFAVILQNFCGEDAWPKLINGIKQGCAELAYEEIQITGSTESNFTLSQSAIGITVLGKAGIGFQSNQLTYIDEINIAVIGKPLVGNEVMDGEEDIAPLSLFKQICLAENVITLPVGSKGIFQELNNLFEAQAFSKDHLRTSLDIEKSSGPSTCFIAVYPMAKQAEIKSLAGPLFHELVVKSG